MAKDKIIKTKRLRITPWSDEQLREALYEAASAEETRKYNEMLAGAQLYPDDRLWYTKWEITLRKDGTSVGEMYFNGPPNGFGAVELHHCLYPAFRGCGYGAESIGELIDFAFRSDGVYFILTEPQFGDELMQAMLKKLGFAETNHFGVRGRFYVLERPRSELTKNLAALGAALGLLLGVFPLGNLQVGALIGIFSGYAIGAYFEVKDRRIRENLRQKRK